MATFCKTIISQTLIHSFLFRFPLHHFITCVGSRVYHHREDTEQFQHDKDPSPCPFITMLAFLPLSPHITLNHNFWQPLICPLFPKYFHFKTLYKWNHTIKPVGLVLFTQHKSPGGLPKLHISVVCSFLFLSSIPQYDCTSLFGHLSLLGYLGLF